MILRRFHTITGTSVSPLADVEDFRLPTNAITIIRILQAGGVRSQRSSDKVPEIMRANGSRSDLRPSFPGRDWYSISTRCHEYRHIHRTEAGASIAYYPICRYISSNTWIDWFAPIPAKFLTLRILAFNHDVKAS